MTKTKRKLVGIVKLLLIAVPFIIVWTFSGQEKRREIKRKFGLED